MGFFKKIFKGIGKVFKKIGKAIKKAFKKVGKFFGKLGIFGQIALAFTPLGPMLQGLFRGLGQDLRTERMANEKLLNEKLSNFRSIELDFINNAGKYNTDWEKLPDEDLKLRGPGDFFGTKQHGYIKSKLANFIEDGSIIRKARNRAFKLIEFDPKLKLEKNQKMINVYLQE